jgi:hypothetical protein
LLETVSKVSSSSHDPPERSLAAKRPKTIGTAEEKFKGQVTSLLMDTSGFPLPIT